MTVEQVDREIGDIIRLRMNGEAKPEDVARYETLLAWRRRNLFPGPARPRDWRRAD